MKITSLLIAVALTFLGGSEIRASDYAPGDLLVKYRPGIDAKNLQGALGKIGWARIKIERNKNMSQAMTALKNDPDVIHVEPNYYGEFLSEPNDPDFEQQWYLSNIEAPAAWDISLGKDVIIGLVDSGVDLDHEDLADNIWTNEGEIPGDAIDNDYNGYIDDVNGWDFGDDDDDPTDEYRHGTMVCGVIAAIQNNELGISGTAPESKILPLKVSEGSTGSFNALGVAEAILYASDHGAKIINLSLALAEYSQLVTDAVAYAVYNGVLLVAAAGRYDTPVRFPALLEEVIAVSATDEDSKFYFKSAQGLEIELSAPGKGIYTTNLGGWYITDSGTSFSCAIVSSVAALVITNHPSLTSDQIRERLIISADDLGDPGKDNKFGYGKVNAFKALKPDPCSAEKIYGEDSAEVTVLRYLRDNILSKTPEGQEIIRLYYKWNPVIVKAIEEDETFKEEIREMIDEVLPLIRTEME